MAENFVRDGRVGDEVWHPCYGNGNLSQTGTAWVLFGQREIFFEPDGRIFSDKYAALCWGHRIAQQINQGRPPIREKEKQAAIKEI